MDEARSAYAMGELDETAAALQLACDAEREFGDDPTYRMLRDWAKAARYQVEEYEADGHAGEPGLYIDNFLSLTDARDAIRVRIGSYFEDPECLWDGMSDSIEAYHSSPDEGCGGYGIQLVEGDAQ